MVMYLCGGAFGPLVTGRLSDYFARQAAGPFPVTEAARAVGLHQAMYIIPALSVVLAAVLWAAGQASCHNEWSRCSTTMPPSRVC
jgi:hypothetical protein